MTKTVTFSTLLRDPKRVIEHLDEGDVLVTRRGAESLRISKEHDAARDQEMTRAFAQMLGALVLDEERVDRLLDRLRIPFGWIDFLDEGEKRVFADEFFHTARACASVGHFDRLAIEVGNWHETALAYSVGLRERPSSLDYLDEESSLVTVEDPRTA